MPWDHWRFLSDRICTDKLEKPNLVNEHELNREHVPLSMYRDQNHVGDFWRSHWLRGKEEMAAFLSSQCWCCGFVATVRDRKIFWSKFLVMCVVKKIMHPETVRQTHCLDPFNRDHRRCDRWMGGEDMGNFLLLRQCVTFAIKFRATRYNNKLYSSGKRTLGLCFGIRISAYRVVWKRQLWKTNSGVRPTETADFPTRSELTGPEGGKWPKFEFGEPLTEDLKLWPCLGRKKS